jgi:cell wall assembly regulator SMI1
LAPGATAADLDQVKSVTGVQLPPDLRESLEVHNGQRDPTRCLKFCGLMGLMSSAEIVRDWQMLTELGEDLEKGRFDRDQYGFFAAHPRFAAE